MVSDALARDRRIGMIQPQRPEEGAPLYDVGTLGHIQEVEALPDGRFNIVLVGEAFSHPARNDGCDARQVEAELLPDPEHQSISAVERAMFEREARHFADAQGYAVDWEQVTRLDDQSLINGVAQIAPFDAASKQALLESPIWRCAVNCWCN
jgi:Lon protease-like protein